jgi:SAM-dependent methyltransferase
MTIPCYICCQSSFVEVINNETSMSSDGQIVAIDIIKEECTNCGTVRSSDVSFLNDFYKNYYKLNIVNNDPLFIYKEEKMLKSQMHFEWINKLIGNKLKNRNSIIEIGCGSGNLLNKFDVKNKYGVEPSKEAFKYASKIAKVRNFGYEEIANNEEYEIILSTCVIEHTIDPNNLYNHNWSSNTRYRKF